MEPQPIDLGREMRHDVGGQSLAGKVLSAVFAPVSTAERNQASVAE
jgi:hypothetical protein